MRRDRGFRTWGQRKAGGGRGMSSKSDTFPKNSNGCMIVIKAIKGYFGQDNKIAR